jgi:tetratricopeptide (TPR) repeat protein
MQKKPIKKPAQRKAAARKRTTNTNPIAKPIIVSSVASAVPVRKSPRWTIYVYWVIILFFVCSTFYILGRGHHILAQRDAAPVQISEQGASLLESGKEKLLGGDVQGAIEDMSAAVESDPNAAIVYSYRGEVYLSEANYAAAEVDFNKAVELDPESSLALYDRALLKIQLGNLDEALVDLNAAIEMNGKRPNEVPVLQNVYSKRAQLNLWLKNWEAAIADYNEALAQSGETPSDEDYAGRADAFTALGDYSTALNDYMSAITTISQTIRDSEDPSIRINMSQRAMSYFEKSAALNVQLNDMAAARANLEAAGTLATALNDTGTQARLAELLGELPEPVQQAQVVTGLPQQIAQ